MNRKIVLAVAAALCGCAGTNSLRDALIIESATLGYLREDGIKLSAPARVDRYQIEGKLPDTLTVKRTGTLIVPLLLYNYWKHEFDVKLGTESFQPTLAAFGSRSLAQDLQKAGAGAEGRPGVSVRVLIRKVESGLVYERSGYFYTALFFNVYGWGNAARDIRSTIQADIVLEKDGIADTLKYAHEESAQIPAQVARSNVNEVAVNAMAETLSLCFKDLHSRILAAMATGGTAGNP